MPIDVDRIKDEVKQSLNPMQRIVINRDSSFYSFYSYNSVSMYPIYYLFDIPGINDKIGYSSDNALAIIRELNLHRSFQMNLDNVEHIGISSHATILYKFRFRDQMYIYYSNSGLGIENQLTDSAKGITSCRILRFEREDLWNHFSSFIDRFIDKVLEEVPKRYRERHDPYVSVSAWFLGRPLDRELFGKIDRIAFSHIFSYVVGQDLYREQKLCYALLNYFMSFPEFRITECTFNYLLYGRDHDQIVEDNDVLYHLSDINACIKNASDSTSAGYNEKFYKLTQRLPNTYTRENNIHYRFVETLKERLNELDTPTIKYKLRNSFALEFTSIGGIYNNIQVTGSCTFYSFYNLGINMLLLQLFDGLAEANFEERINRFLEAFVKVHYSLINLLCINNDKRHLPFRSPDIYNELTLHNYSYISKLMQDLNIADEIITFYGRENLFLDNQSFALDKLLDVKLDFHGLENVNNIIQIENTSQFDKFRDYIDRIIFNMRQGKFIENIPEFYEEIHNNFNVNVLQFFNSISREIAWDDQNVLHNVCEIYAIYLIILNDYYREYVPGNIINKKFRNYKILRIGSNVRDTQCDFISFDRKNIRSIQSYFESLENNLTDLLVSRLNTNEIMNIYSKINDEIIQQLRIKHRVVFRYCEPLFTSTIEFSNHLMSIYENNDTLINTYLFREIGYGDVSLKIKDQISTYIKIVNKYKNKLLKNDKVYLEILNKIKYKLISKKSLILNEYHVHNFRDISKLIYILSDRKYILINNAYQAELFYDLSLIDSHTKIILVNNVPYVIPTDFIVSIIDQFEKNTDGNYEKIISNVLEFFASVVNKITWIDKCGFKLNQNSISKDGNEYNLYSFRKKLEYGVNTTTRIVLSRFGITFKDNSRTVIAIQDHDKFRIDRNSNAYIILINEQKIIEINYNASGVINKDECFIIDKEGRYQLIFDIKSKKLPFAELIPTFAPYLCYIKGLQYYVDCNVYSSVNLDQSNGEFVKSFVLFSKTNLEDYHKYLQIKISPSLLLPSIESFDLDSYLKLCELYHMKYNSFNLLKEEYQSIIKIEDPVDVLRVRSRIISFLESGIKLLSDNLTIDEVNLKKFKDVFSGDLTDVQRKSVFDSFMYENRVCTKYTCDRVCIDRDIQGLIKGLLAELSTIKDEVKFKNYFYDYITHNLPKFILIMITNMSINLLKQIKEGISCWDIQFILTSLNSINYFCQKIQTDYFNKFEIFFLLQNDYFFKETQIVKYKSILNDIVNNNPSLKLHQFMMGKGKTSVITPLLAFAISIHEIKIPTIITSSHLVDQTKKYISLTEHLFKLKIDIMSDSEAKKRFIEHTDSSLRSQWHPIHLSKIEDEVNIIDEFDSHHNYLQSMFNYVTEKVKLDERLYNFIFDYTISKLKNKKFTYDLSTLEDTTNICVLISTFSKIYKNSESMRYNENFGFSFLYNLEELGQIYRLVIPFSRKDTPIQKSNFSSLILIFILTIRTYCVHYDGMFQDFDYINFVKNPSLLMSLVPLINEKYIPKIHDFIDNDFLSEQIKIQKLTEIFTEIYAENTEEYRFTLIKKYIFEANKNKFEITTKQINMSFQDIIYNVYEQMQVGYTGTTSLELNKYDPSEKFVFREKIEDFDEKIEVKLAIDGYGSPPSWSTNVTIINPELNINESLDKLLKVISNNPRGIVDLAGLFIDYDNKKVAEIIKSKLVDKKIVYLSNEHAGLEYSESNSQPYVQSDVNNFYYYDQCHVVGSDLKQPREGHVIVIINNKTRWTDFAQAIFRFRKLNRGTYLSIAFVDTDTRLVLTNKNIYKMLNDNEIEFNSKQKDGIKFQLMKAMVRKLTRDYSEIDLEPEYLSKNKFNKEILLRKIINNINGLRIYNSSGYIKKLYQYFESLEFEKLYGLLFGIGIEHQQEQQQQRQAEQARQKEAMNQRARELIELFNRNRYDRFIRNQHTVIEHLNCDRCIENNCRKLFTDDSIKINSKSIYISYNFLYFITNGLILQTISSNEIVPNHYDLPFSGRICFVEFTDKILIEREDISLDYYSHKLPVYDFLGNLLFPNMYNVNNTFVSKLDIDEKFVRLLGLTGYLNPMINKRVQEIDLTKTVKLFTTMGLFLFSLLFIFQKCNRYNLSSELFNEITILLRNLALIERIPKSEKPHNITPNTNILPIYFDIYSKNINLSERGYSGTIPIYRIPQFFYWGYIFSDPDIKTLNRLLGGGSSDNKYYYKYLKYKEKYKQLKNNN